MAPRPSNGRCGFALSRRIAVPAGAGGGPGGGGPGRIDRAREPPTQPRRPATQCGAGRLGMPIQQPFVRFFRWAPSAKFQNVQPPAGYPQHAAAQLAELWAAATCFPPKHCVFFSECGNVDSLHAVCAAMTTAAASGKPARISTTSSRSSCRTEGVMFPAAHCSALRRSESDLSRSVAARKDPSALAWGGSLIRLIRRSSNSRPNPALSETLVRESPCRIRIHARVSQKMQCSENMQNSNTISNSGL